MLYYEFFVQFVWQQLNLLCCSCMSRGTHPAMFLATCLATCPSGDEVKVEDVFLLADRTKHCETSCKRGVTLCNASKIRCSVAAIVAKCWIWFYFVQRLLQQKFCETWLLQGMLYRAISHATCVATKLRDKSHEKLHSVTPPLRIILYSKVPR